MGEISKGVANTLLAAKNTCIHIQKNYTRNNKPAMYRSIQVVILHYIFIYFEKKNTALNVF
jgi:hypothetical protein